MRQPQYYRPDVDPWWSVAVRTRAPWTLWWVPDLLVAAVGALVALTVIDARPGFVAGFYGISLFMMLLRCS